MLMEWRERCRVEVTDCGACGAGAAQQVTFLMLRAYRRKVGRFFFFFSQSWPVSSMEGIEFMIRALVPMKNS